MCEGASEKAYIQELNRYLQEEEDIPLHFIPRPSNGGQYSFVVKKYKEVRKDNRIGEILIWVDWWIIRPFSPSESGKKSSAESGSCSPASRVVA